MVKVGRWAFTIGIFLSILAGFVDWGGIPIILIVLGLVVGFLNIDDKEAVRFLVASIALLSIGTASISSLFTTGRFAGATQLVLSDFISFVAAAALIVALKTVVTLGEKDSAEK
jgi:hypothetical protein